MLGALTLYEELSLDHDRLLVLVEAALAALGSGDVRRAEVFLGVAVDTAAARRSER